MALSTPTSIRFTALAAALVVTLVAALAVVAPVSSAEAAQVRGTVMFNSGARAGVNNLQLQRWTGSSWIVSKTGKSDSNGNFTFTSVGAGWYYRVYAARTVGGCGYGQGIDYYQGWSNYIWLATPTSMPATNPYVSWNYRVWC